MNQLAFTKNLDLKVSEGLHIGADTVSEHVTHSLKHTEIHSPHTHSHTHISQSEGEGTFIFFSLAGLCATGAKAKGEERTQEGTHSSSLHSGFCGQEIVHWCCLVSYNIILQCVSATNMANRIIRR